MFRINKLNEGSYYMLCQFLNERLIKETDSKEGEISNKTIKLANTVSNFKSTLEGKSNDEI